MRRGMLLGLAAIALNCGESRATELLYQSQSRQVEAAIFYPNGSSTDLSVAPDFGPFHASAVAEYNSPQGPGSASAVQTSALKSDGFEIHGSSLIQNPFFASEVALYSVRWIFDISFQLTQPLPYSLSAEFDGVWDTGGTNVNAGDFLVEFVGPDGAIVADGESTPGPLPQGQFEEALIYDTSGILQPGLYQLHVEFSDELLAFGNSNDPPWSYGIGGGGSSEFSLVFAAPEPESAMLMAIVPALRRRRRRRA